MAGNRVPRPATARRRLDLSAAVWTRVGAATYRRPGATRSTPCIPCALTPQAAAAAGQEPRCRRRLGWGGPVREGARILTVLTIVAPIEPKIFLHVTHVIIGYSVLLYGIVESLMTHTEFSLILFLM